MMKKLATLLFGLMLAISISAQSANVVYNLTDFTSAPQSASILTITPLVNGGVLGAYLLTSQARSFAVATNSSVTVSNVVMGYSYQVQFQNSSYRTISMWTNQFPANLTGQINGADWVFYNFVLANKSASGGVYWNTSSTNSVSNRSATVLWVYPSPPYNTTNYPYSLVATN